MNPIEAFDRAAERLLAVDFTTGFQQNANIVLGDGVGKLRALFQEELEESSAPGPQACSS